MSSQLCALREHLSLRSRSESLRTKRLEALRLSLHTSSSEIAAGEVSKMLLMDHLDWISVADVEEEISALLPKLAPHAVVFWHSGSMVRRRGGADQDPGTCTCN